MERDTVGSGSCAESFGFCLERVGRVDWNLTVRFGVLAGSRGWGDCLFLSDARFGMDVLEDSQKEMADKDACGLCLLAGLAFVPCFVSVSEEIYVFLLT